MFRFQDLLYTKTVYPTWMSAFHTWVESLLNDIHQDEYLTSTKPKNALGINKDTGDEIDLTIAQAYTYQILTASCCYLVVE